MTLLFLILSGTLTIAAFATKMWLLDRCMERAIKSGRPRDSLIVILLFPMLFAVGYGLLICTLVLFALQIAASADRV